MWIKRIKINYNTALGVKGEKSSIFDFSSKFNLVSSNGVNSQGKTSLIRFIIWGLGFDVGLTRMFSKRYSSVLLIINNNDRIYYICRTEFNVEIKYDNRHIKFSLRNKDKQNPIIRLLMNNVGNEYLYSQILGLFYYDQDQGLKTWNLGNIVQSFGRDYKYRINFKSILFGLHNKNYKMFHTQIRKWYLQSAHIRKLINAIQSFSTNTHRVAKDNNTLSKHNCELMDDISAFNLRKRQIYDYFNLYKNSIRDKKEFYKLLGKLNVKINVRIDSKHIKRIAVTSKNIVKNDLENMKLRYIAKYYKLKIERVDYVLKKLRKKREDLFNINVSAHKDKDYFRVRKEVALSGINIDNLYRSKNNVDVKRTSLKNNIKHFLKHDKQYRNTWDWAVKFSKNLNLSLFFNIRQNKLLTRVIKYSGAQRSLVILTLRIAMYKTVMNSLHVNLPIIIDSPGSQEMDENNLNKFLTNLKHFFPNTQLIVATNNNLNIQPNKKILLQNGIFGDL